MKGQVGGTGGTIKQPRHPTPTATKFCISKTLSTVLEVSWSYLIEIDVTGQQQQKQLLLPALPEDQHLASLCRLAR